MQKNKENTSTPPPDTYNVRYRYLRYFVTLLTLLSTFIFRHILLVFNCLKYLQSTV